MTTSILGRSLDRYERLRQDLAAACLELGPAVLDARTSEGKRTIRLLLTRECTHEMSHVEQIRACRETIGRFPYSELELLLMRAAEARGHVLASMIGLSDDEMQVHPAEGEWSIKEVLEHLVSVEERRLDEVQRLRAMRAQSSE